MNGPPRFERPRFERPRFERMVPIFPTRDLDAALEFYARLGFDVRRYAGGGYGYATRGPVQLHVGVVPRAVSPASAYLVVDDADAVAREWADTGADVRPPEDTEWGMHEGVVIDPDGNIIRFGSVPRHRSG